MWLDDGTGFTGTVTVATVHDANLPQNLYCGWLLLCQVTEDCDWQTAVGFKFCCMCHHCHKHTEVWQRLTLSNEAWPALTGCDWLHSVPDWCNHVSLWARCMYGRWSLVDLRMVLWENIEFCYSILSFQKTRLRHWHFKLEAVCHLALLQILHFNVW